MHRNPRILKKYFRVMWASRVSFSIRLFTLCIAVASVQAFIAHPVGRLKIRTRAVVKPCRTDTCVSRTSYPSNRRPHKALRAGGGELNSIEGRDVIDAAGPQTIAPLGEFPETLSDPTFSNSAALQEQEEERRATNLELFLDLSFVYAVSQITETLDEDLTSADFGGAVILCWLVYWLFQQFTWLGTSVDLGKDRGAQLQVLCTIPFILFMGGHVHSAFEESGVQFAAAYLAVSLAALAVQGISMWKSSLAGKAWIAYLPLAILAPGLLLAAAQLDENSRLYAWAGVAAVQVGSAFFASSKNSNHNWCIDPAHFAERHALFVIISLGEILTAIGSSTADNNVMTEPVAAGLVVTTSLSCLLWWSYFAFVSERAEHKLRMTPAEDRAVVARDLFTFGHFPIIFGIVLLACVAKHVADDPLRVMDTYHLSALSGGVTSVVGGLMGLHWQVLKQVRPERVAVIGLIAGLCAVYGQQMPGVETVGIACILLAIQQGYTFWVAKAYTM